MIAKVYIWHESRGKDLLIVNSNEWSLEHLPGLCFGYYSEYYYYYSYFSQVKYGHGFNFDGMVSTLIESLSMLQGNIIMVP